MMKKISNLTGAPLTGSLLGTLVLLATALPAEPPSRLVDARVTTHTAEADLLAQIDALSQKLGHGGWIAYTVPIQVDRAWICCHNDAGECTRCELRGEDVTAFQDGPSPGCSGEPSHLQVFLHGHRGTLDTVRIFSSNCEVDAGGAPVFWLESVAPDASRTALAALVRRFEGQGEEWLSKTAIGALAHHSGAATDATLAGLAAPDQPAGQRERVAFWLGNARGEEGYQVLRRMALEDPSEEVRQGVVFGLSVSRRPEAIDTLIHLAREDESSAVRAGALFWLAHKTGDRVAATIRQASEQDADSEVREKAVFALSQLPADEGIPRLLEVARTHSDPELRKRAIFWLGQSEDPRALEFFAETLRPTEGDSP